MKRTFLAFFYLGLVSVLPTVAQEVLWAKKVLEKSSESVDLQYSPKHRAMQILGKPNVLPQTVSSPCSWRPTGTGYGEDYIKVGFEKAIRVRQIVICENQNPGAVGRIFGYTTDNQEILLFENKDSAPRISGRTWNIIIPETQREIASLKLLIVHSISKGVKEYDAVGISSSEQPFVARINNAMNLPKDLKRENLGSNINSRFGEVAPLVTPDGKNLYFTRLNHPGNIFEKVKGKDKVAVIKQDIWQSTIQKDGTWEFAFNLGDPINNLEENAAATLSADGKSLYVLNLYLSGGRNAQGLSKATQKNKKWQMPTKVQINDFQALEEVDVRRGTSKTTTEFSISTDEKVLVMGLKRIESLGDRDLYVSFKIGTDTYSKPLSLGPIINSAANEGSPFLAADGKTLYFNSLGHPGYGDADLFVTQRLDETWTNWSDPINLGPVINSPEWDGYISIPASGEYAYFSSTKDSQGSDDIFRVKLFPTVKPKPVILYDVTFKDKTAKALQPDFELVQIPIKADTGWKYTPLLYSLDEESKVYKIILSPGDIYEIRAKLDGYESITHRIDLQKEKSYKEAKVVLEMISNEKKSEITTMVEGEKIVLRKLLFEQGKSTIKEESFTELNIIKKMMVENQKMEILLEGHSDNQGDAAKNIKLAEDRVNEVKKFILNETQIDQKRIVLKSWGPYKPLVTNQDEESRSKNRRVEFTILKL
ncbi:MAG: OmpA family protein [Leadbetterella sp.]